MSESSQPGRLSFESTLEPPTSILQCWLIAFKSCEVLKRCDVIVTPQLWYQLSHTSGIDTDAAIRCAAAGCANVQVLFESTFTDDESAVVRFTIVDAEEESITIIANKPK